jgi:patatin-like phospholipase/acyl hydrolase
MTKNNKGYKVLVICGGGIFGYIPAVLLAGTGFNQKGYMMADAMGGTSIGGILSLMYAHGYTPEEVKTKFVELADKTFYRPWYSALWPWGAKFDGKGLEESLDTLFKERTFGNLKKPLVIPTLDFQHNKPKIYDNMIKDKDFDVLMKDLGRMTSAAPTYFPPKDGHIDGGLLANNPVIETVSAIKSKLNIPFEVMDVLAIGTGHFPRVERDMEAVKKWSAVNWLPPMLKYLTKANEMKSDFVAKQLGLKSYKLYNPVEIDPDWDMDQPELVPKLEKLASVWQNNFNTVFRGFQEN